MPCVEEIRKSVFEGIRKVVVKVGSRILCDDANGINRPNIEHLVDELDRLQDAGYRVVLVTSGAVGVGMGALGYESRPAALAEKQACAAVGQIRLMHLYTELLAKKGKTAAQILLSGEDFLDKARFNNIRHTVNALLDRKVIPIVNENDTTSTAELKVGDNDKLSADVAHFLEAELLIILSDENGLYTKNPKQHPDAAPLSIVPRVTPEIFRMAGEGAGSKVSVGGMKAKLKAIQQATEAGTPAVLTAGSRAKLLEIATGGKIGTLFLPKASRIGRAKRWLAFVSKAKGEILLDPGGVKALRGGKSSLLAAGVKKSRGHYRAGDFVEICTLDGEVIGRGRSGYSSAEVQKIKGRKSFEIAALLGRSGPGEIIHRDHLVMY